MRNASNLIKLRTSFFYLREPTAINQRQQNSIYATFNGSKIASVKLENSQPAQMKSKRIRTVTEDGDHVIGSVDSTQNSRKKHKERATYSPVYTPTPMVVPFAVNVDPQL